MLKLKMTNSIGLAQNTPGRERQDFKHVRMMTICCSAYLEEVAEMEDLPVRDRLHALNGSLTDLIDLHEKHYHTHRFRLEHGWEVKDCVPANVLTMAQGNDPIYRELRRNLMRLGFAQSGPGAD